LRLTVGSPLGVPVNRFSDGKAPDEVIIGWAFNTLPGGSTALCVIGNRTL